MTYHAEHDPYFAITDTSDQYFIEHLQTHISSRQAKVYVAIIDRQIVGYIMAKIEQRPPIFVHQRFGMISDLAVSTECRRQGVGRLLTEHVLTWFKSRNIDRAELILLSANPLSTRFWEAMGFKVYCARLFREI